MCKEAINNAQIRKAVMSATKTIFKGHRNWKKKVTQDFEWRLENKIREILNDEENYICDEN